MEDKITKISIANSIYDIKDRYINGSLYTMNIPIFNTIEEVNEHNPKNGEVVLLKYFPIIYISGDTTNYFYESMSKSVNGWFTYDMPGYSINVIKSDDDYILPNGEIYSSCLDYVHNNVNYNGDANSGGMGVKCNIIGATSIEALFSEPFVIGNNQNFSANYRYNDVRIQKLLAAQCNMIINLNLGNICMVHNLRHFGSFSGGIEGSMQYIFSTANSYITHDIKMANYVGTNTKTAYFEKYYTTIYGALKMHDLIGFDITKDSEYEYIDFITLNTLDSTTVLNNFDSYVIADIVLDTSTVLEEWTTTWSSQGLRHTSNYHRYKPTLYLIQVGEIAQA